MRRKKQISFRFHNVARALLLATLVSLYSLFIPFKAQATDLASRSISLKSSVAGETTQHLFTFTNPTASTLGSIKFEYCQNSPLFFESCTAPGGLNLSSATLAVQTGNAGFVKDPLSTATSLIISRTPGGSLSTVNTYRFDSVINPTTINTTYFVRISLYASNNATGVSFDQGAVAFSTSGGFSIGAYVPPFMIFCVGVTVAQDCSSTVGSLVNFGELESNKTSFTTTQFAGATNDPTGMQVFLNGQTMTSGNNTIPALAVNSSSATGTSQFGVNLRSNNAPSVGSSRTGPGTMFATTNYDVQNQYRFVDGDVIARSTISTDFTRMTVSYIVNVSEDQKPGIYATTLLYTALASF